MYPRLSRLLILPVLCLHSFASESDVSVRTLAFDLPRPELTLSLAAAESDSTDGDVLELEVRRNQFGEASKLSPGNYLARLEGVDEPIRIRLPSTEKGARYLLLVLSEPGGGSGILPIPDHAERIGPGDRFFYNATRHEIAIRLGAAKSRLKPSRSVVLEMPSPPPADRRLEVEMLQLIEAEWVPFNSTYWPLDPKARSFVLVFPDPSTGRPRVRNLAEVP